MYSTRSARDDFAARAAHALGLDHIGGGAQAGGIDQVHRQAVEMHLLAQHVAGGARARP